MSGRVLITGGAGFLGSHLCDRLLAEGYAVRVLDALDPQVHPHGAPDYLDPEVELRVGSVLDLNAVEAALEGVSRVVHFAAVVGVGQSMYQPARYSEVNIQGTAVLLQALLGRARKPTLVTKNGGGSAGSGGAGGIERLLLAGSMSMYGEGRYRCGGCGSEVEGSGRTLEQLRRQAWELACPRCGAELAPLPTDEAKAPQLGSMYALSKRVQEQMGLLFGKTYRIPTVVLRFFNTYGPRQALSNPYTGVAAVFAAELLAGRAPRVFEDGRQLRDLVSVHDVVAACARALEIDAAREGVDGGIFNIASGERLTVAGLAAALAQGLGVEREPVLTGQFRLGDARHCVADIGAARRVLGYEPQTSLAQGLAELAAWLGGQRAPAAGGRTQAKATEELFTFGLAG